MVMSEERTGLSVSYLMYKMSICSVPTLAENPGKYQFSLVINVTILATSS